jgi:hypothetical protein
MLLRSVWEWRYSSNLTLTLIGDECSSLILRPLCLQGKKPQFPLERRLNGSQSRSERSGEEKTFFLLPGMNYYYSA